MSSASRQSPENLPLIERDPGQVLVRSRDGRRVSVAAFSASVLALAERLPPAAHVLNLCADRARFLLAFCASLLRTQCTLMAPNRLPATQRELARRYADTVVLHDGQDLAPGLSALRVTDASFLDAAQPAPLPALLPEQLAVVCFTSGSTGQSTATPKTWRTLALSTAINRRALLGDRDSSHGLLATVPPQHMYGMETSILLPLITDLVVHPAHPLYPDDIRSALAELSAPRILVTTPPHLRTLLASGLSFPAVDLVISATAPLDGDTAREAEAQFGARVREVYGCSEVGCIASREPARERWWRPFSAFRFRERSGQWLIDADHLNAPVPLGDRLSFDPRGRFELKGRLNDRVNIAGKRGSLSELTALLLNHPDVSDGVIFQPPDPADRLAGMAVAPGLSAREIRDYMREKIDPVFLPRPLLLVEALPRTAGGKLPLAALHQIYRKHRRPT